MNAQELRIGNWVILPGKQIEEQSQITSIEVHFHIGDNTYLDIANGYSVHDIEPIPLTPEILEAFGLKPNEYSVKGPQFDEPFFDINLQAKGWLINWDHTFGWFIAPVTSQYNVTPVKYLHQLQNLYFALTSTELTKK